MKRSSIFWLFGALAGACALSLACGAAGFMAPSVILDIRLPRTAAAVIVGAGLGLAGAIFQSLLKNPLSDPYILGTSSGATAAAVLCITLGVERASPAFYALVFAGAFCATFISYGIARSARNLSEAGLVLSGIVVSSFISALVMLFLALSKERSFSMLYFVMGGIYCAEPGLLIVSALVIFAAFAASFLSWRRLDLLTLGEEKAYHMGASPASARILFFALASAATAGAVAIGGTIGFVGLIAPHIVRLAFGASNRTLLAASALGGAAFLTFADTLGRTVAAPSEIPSGVITALIGAPFFLWLLWKSSRNSAQ